MLLSEEGRDFSLLYQIIFEYWDQSSFAYSHQLSEEVVFYLRASTEQTSRQKSFALSQHMFLERDLHSFAWETLAPSSRPGQKAVRNGLAHWPQRVESLTEPQNPVAACDRCPQSYLTRAQKAPSQPLQPCWCAREGVTALTLTQDWCSHPTCSPEPRLSEPKPDAWEV